MNEELKKLMEFCEAMEFTIMRFNIYDTSLERSVAIIEDKEGRLSTISNHNGLWA